jgi:catecholate siderophore receptor
VVDRSSLTKFTESLQDTPQSITALSKELLEDRNAMSLNDALRNVPGITLGAGEFTWQGNNPTIRGFNSRNDMFLDGMRDYGSYYRDPFYLEAVEVLQGPSSMIFGRGSTGGVIHQTSKVPEAEAFRRLHLNMGSADTFRATADVNQPIAALGDHGGLRVNLVQQTGGVVDRDVAESEHWGVAPSLAAELGDATLLTLGYLKMEGDSIPDYGLPWLGNAPAPVDRTNFYGFASDYMDTTTDIASLRLEHSFSEDLNLSLALRHADYDRHSRISEPLLPAGVTAATPLAGINVNRNVFNGDSNERMLFGQANLVANLETGSIRHALVSGIEWGEESSSPIMRLAVGVPTTSLLNPQPMAFSATRMQVRARANTDSDSLAAYVLDTLKFGDEWQLVLGARWDDFATNYIADRYDANGVTAGKEQVLRRDIETSSRAALVYKPSENQTWYAGWGTSFNPSSEGLSFIANARNFGISNAFLEPEKNRSVEFGSKWSLFSGRLQLDGAVFDIVKSNARVPDPGRPGFNALAGEQEVQGAALTVSGTPLPGLSVSGGYTFLDSEEVKTAPTLDNRGRALANVARNNFSLWLNYRVHTALELGVGGRYIGERLARNTSPILAAPGYWAFDAMGKYTLSPHVTLKLNVTNLGDKEFFDQLHPFHVVPGPGLGAVFAINLDY